LSENAKITAQIDLQLYNIKSERYFTKKFR